MTGKRLRRRGVALAGTAVAVGLVCDGRGREAGFAVAAPVANQLWCSLQSLGTLGSASVAEAMPAAAPAETGQWSAVQSWPVRCVHTHVLSNGRVMTWSSYLEADTPTTWNPATGQFVQLAQAGYNIFCSGHSLMADGRVFVAGGHIAGAGGDPQGFRYAKIYNPGTNAWTSLPDMNAGRWYPSTTTLPNGDILVLSGTNETGHEWNTLPQVWQVASNSWRNLHGADSPAPWYPLTFVAPNGQIFYAGPDQWTGYLDPAGDGAWHHLAWSNFGDRGWSGPAAVMYDQGKVLLVGGGNVDLPPTASAEVIDLNQPQPAWRFVNSMAVPRRQHNATLLPDGSVLVTGGHSGPGQDAPSSPVYQAELWDPATEQWRTQASAAVFRGYHSVALLLPDGRVLSAGGDIGGSTAEVFSPPYLFRGTRPTISSVKATPTSTGTINTVRYGQTFFVGTQQATSINRVTWIRLPSVTHSFNFNQGMNRLSFAQAAGGLNVTAPANSASCPPGHYMLFILNGDGVPSQARILRIRA